MIGVEMSGEEVASAFEFRGRLGVFAGRRSTSSRASSEAALPPAAVFETRRQGRKARQDRVNQEHVVPEAASDALGREAVKTFQSKNSTTALASASLLPPFFDAPFRVPR